MNLESFEPFEVDGLSGKLRTDCVSAGGGALFSGMDGLLSQGRVLHAGRHCTVCVRLDGQTGGDDVVIKSFGRQSRWKDVADSQRGSKAARSWGAAVHLAAHGVRTPEPLGYLERWEGGRLMGSYYISRYEADTVSFADELGRLFAEAPETARFMDLLGQVARFAAAMHASGYVHQDFGNQNILMRRAGGSWCDLMVIDLNRGRVCPVLTDLQRARDLSRIALPSDFLRVFLEMYSDGVPSAAFLDAEARYRRRFSRHTASRRWRHPIRSWRERDAEQVHRYPSERDMWVWDERSGQALTVHVSKARSRLYPLNRHLGVLPVVPAALAAWRDYRELLPTAFQSPVVMDCRLGVAIEPSVADGDVEQSLFDGLGAGCAQVRFYRHKGPEQWARAGTLVRHLASKGVHVGVCLLQDRAAVVDGARWEEFCRDVLCLVKGAAAEVEVAHAINRVKWGIWDWREYRRLLVGAWQAADAVWPDAPLTGPAAIDFEFHYVLAALRQVPANRCFAGLSHHLYVDRRGAPERPQGHFATVEKAALALAIARTHRACEGRLVVSEVNWPLADTGVYSPVGAPYESPGVRHHDPSVSEIEYAHYLVRYALLCLCSGFVERIYWWRLVAHGYGLVDGPPAALRKRPAYEACARLCQLLRGATFQRARRRGDEGGDGVWVLLFEAASGPFWITWCDHGTAEIAVEGAVSAYGIVDGNARVVSGLQLTIGGDPVVCHLR